MTSMNELQARMVGLTGAYKGMEFYLSKNDFLIGRLPDCDLPLNENTLSAKHAKISRAGDRFEIIDLNSTNGTFVNGERITRKVLRSDDRIRVDVFEFLFVNPADVSRTVIARIPDAVKIDETVVRPLPETDVTQPVERIEVNPTPEPFPPQRSGGSVWGGLVLGLALALLIAGGGHLLVAWSFMRFSPIQGLLPVAMRTFPLAFLHTAWMNVHWSPLAVADLLCLIFGLFAGGLATQSLGRRSRFAAALLFSIGFVLVSLLIQLAALKFDVGAWQPVLLTAGLGTGNPALNLAVVAIYFFWVSLIVSFCGALLGRK
jgi:pSer/pThr/pTyr-binding forkhead associated (FHA) protein